MPINTPKCYKVCKQYVILRTKFEIPLSDYALEISLLLNYIRKTAAQYSKYPKIPPKFHFYLPVICFNMCDKYSSISIRPLGVFLILLFVTKFEKF